MKAKLCAAFAAALMLTACGDQSGGGVAREAVNPWEWSAQFGFNQGEVITGQTRTLYLAGQVAVDESGAPMHAGDTRAQLALAFDNLDAVLGAADMDRADVARLTIFTTDMQGILANWDVYMARYAEAGHTPPVTLIGVASLYEPDLVVEVEAVAVD